MAGRTKTQGPRLCQRHCSSWQNIRRIINRVEEKAKTVGLRINADKTKVMIVGKMESGQNIQAEGNTIEKVANFCYFSSVVSQDSSCGHNIKTRIGKANSNYGKLNNIWRSKKLNNNINIRLYESIILSTLLYAAESWPMTNANMKKLEAAHHKWQKKILGITWQDRVTNDEVGRESSSWNTS